MTELGSRTIIQPFVGRRQVLAGFGAATVGVTAHPVLAVVPQTKERRLRFHTLRTREYADLVYWRDGAYLENGLAEADYALRDGRDNTQIPINVGLLDQLFALQRALGTERPYTVICGYRSPETNALLRSKRRGVAQNSYHLYGEAVDIRIEGVALRTLRNAAIRLNWGGVGYYGRSNFVHLDVGPPRSW